MRLTLIVLLGRVRVHSVMTRVFVGVLLAQAFSILCFHFVILLCISLALLENRWESSFNILLLQACLGTNAGELVVRKIWLSDLAENRIVA